MFPLGIVQAIAPHGDSRGPWRPVTPKAWSLRTTTSNKKGYLMEYINHWLYMGLTIGYYIIAIYSHMNIVLISGIPEPYS